MKHKKLKDTRMLVHMLNKQYQEIQASSNNNYYYSIGISPEEVCKWDVVIYGPRGTPYENGMFKGIMLFPDGFPYTPPTFKFTSKIWHPNIDNQGNVCISILHQPGDDIHEYESYGERWLPTRSIDSVIISIISLLSEPNTESPANLEANRTYLEDYEEFNRIVADCVKSSLDNFY